MSGVRFEIVETGERLAAVGPAWMALWRQTGALVFQSHAWVTAWWTTLPDRERRDLRIVLAWTGDELTAVLPLAICRRRGFRMLEWAAREHSDYCDALLAPNGDPAILQQMWALVSTTIRFDFVYLNRLLPTALARALFAPGARGVLRPRPSHRRETSLRVSGAWPSGAAWLQAQSKKRRQNYRRGLAFLEQSGDVRFRLLAADEPMDPVLDRVRVFKRLHLERRELDFALFEAEAPTLRAFVQVLADLGLLRLFVLECGGAIVAVSINFCQADTMMAFVTTYDAALERGSPGMVLMVDYIKWSIDRRIGMVDFLCGGEPFKGKFATADVTMDAVIGAKTLKGLVAVTVDRHAKRGRDLWRRVAKTMRQAGTVFPHARIRRSFQRSPVSKSDRQEEATDGEASKQEIVIRVGS